MPSWYGPPIKANSGLFTFENSNGVKLAANNLENLNKAISADMAKSVQEQWLEWTVSNTDQLIYTTTGAGAAPVIPYYNDENAPIVPIDPVVIPDIEERRFK